MASSSTTRTKGRYFEFITDKNKPVNFDEYSLDSIANLQVLKSNQRLLQKLKNDMANDSFYEIHQLYKTIHFRFGSNLDLVNSEI